MMCYFQLQCMDTSHGWWKKKKKKKEEEGIRGRKRRMIVLKCVGDDNVEDSMKCKDDKRISD